MIHFIKHFKQTVLSIILFFIFIVSIFTITLYSIHNLAVKSFQKAEIQNFQNILNSNIKLLQNEIDNLLNTSLGKERIIKKIFLNNIFNFINIVYQNSKAKGYDDNTIKEIIKNSLLNLKFSDKNEYFYIQKIDGTLILNPALRKLEGKNLKNFQDCNGEFFIRKVIENSIKYGQGWVKYCLKLDNKEIEKETFFKLFKPFNWIIGITFNYEIFYNQLKNKIIEKLMSMIIPDFAGIVLFDKNNNIIYFKSAINMDAKDIFKKDKFMFKSFTIKNYNWKVIFFIDKNQVFKGIKNGDKIFKEAFFKRLLLLILIIFFTTFFLIKYLLKITDNYNSELENLKDTIKDKKIKNNSFSIKEFHEIYNTFLDVYKKLENEKSFSQFILSTVNLGIISLDNNFKIRYINRFIEIISKWEKDELINKNFFNIFQPFIIKHNKKILLTEENFLEFIKEKIFNFEYVYILNKEKIQIPVKIYINKNREDTNYVLAISDETLNITKELEFRRLFAVSNSAPFPILITDIDKKIIYANPYFLSFYGYSLEEIKGKSPKIFGTEYNQKFYKELLQKIHNKEVYEAIFLNKTKDGKEFWEHNYIVPVLTDDGEIINFISYKEDITEKKLIEEKLIEAKNKAEKYAEMKSLFLANMSHELRTPLNGIIGFVDLMIEKETDPQKLNYLNIIKDSSYSLLNIINSILDYSKLETGKMHFEILNFNIKSLILNCVRAHKAIADKKGIKLLYSIDEDNIPQYLKGDRLRILQVLNNLVGNALKFTEKGYVKISVNVINKTDEIITLKFTVEDTGTGINQEKIKEIFKPFIQADSSTTRKFGGTGLGLAISKEIIKNLGGKLEVESEEGKGTKFFFTLTFPIGDKIIFTEEKVNTHKKVDFSSLKVIIAEDDVFNQEYFTRIFEKLNINAEIKPNGKELIKTMEGKDFDIVFLDINMPVLDGKETAKIIRKLEKGEEVKGFDNTFFIGKKHPIIALTADLDYKIKEELIDAGFDEFLLKPFKFDEFLKIISKFSKKKNNIFNLKELDELTDFNEDLKNELIKIFKENCREIIKEFEFSLKNNDYDNLKKISHKLKGAAGNIRAEKIYKLAIEMEDAAKNNDFKKFQQLYNDFKNTVKNF